ncbi:MAG: hypothetical protein M3Q46_06040 [Verrucomicrobiota bacterium]|nr:hypothetical protein [Verrucomicrobiota bacterium]
MESRSLAAWLRSLGIAGTGALSILNSALAEGVRPEVTSSVVVEGSRTSYALPPGATSFIICLTGTSPSRDFTFLNENIRAAGRLSIAVSNQRLAPDSPEWSTVEGVVPFRHKRRFTLSLVGIEANYVRLTFQVEPPDEAKSASYSGIAVAQAFASPACKTFGRPRDSL